MTKKLRSGSSRAGTDRKSAGKTEPICCWKECMYAVDFFIHFCPPSHYIYSLPLLCTQALFPPAQIICDFADNLWATFDENIFLSGRLLQRPSNPGGWRRAGGRHTEEHLPGKFFSFFRKKELFNLKFRQYEGDGSWRKRRAKLELPRQFPVAIR